MNLKKIKTLAMLKMEKNFLALLKKGYPRVPYLRQDLLFLVKRLRQELKELDRAVFMIDYDNIREELADISNLVDYAYERSFIEEKEEKKDIGKGLFET